MKKKYSLNAVSKPVEEKIEGDFMRVPDKKKSFKETIWSGDSKQFLGRTGESWAKILIFYLVYYIVLSAYSLGLFTVFYQTLDEARPKYLEIIGENPGLAFRPIADNDDTMSVLEYKPSDPCSTAKFVQSLDEFLKDYQNITEIEDNRMQCDFMNPAVDGKACKFDVNDDTFGPCTNANHYGFDSASPCIFMKLNKIFDWKPEFYEIAEMQNINRTINGEDSDVKEMIWLTCEYKTAETGAAFGFYPQSGFPSFYYPYNKQEGYKSPLVAVQFEDLPYNTKIGVECKAWAKNIQHDASERRGAIKFNFFVEN